MAKNISSASYTEIALKTKRGQVSVNKFFEDYDFIILAESKKNSSMKTLYIMRHGKAEVGSDKADYKRKLISKGIKRSLKIGQMLKDRKGNFDYLLCSNASRTLETAELMADLFDFPQSEIQQTQEFYLAPVNVMLDSFYTLDNSYSSVLVVGHNPGISELVTSLSGQLIDWMPTSALIAIEIDTDKWEEISSASAKIAFSLSPKGM